MINLFRKMFSKEEKKPEIYDTCFSDVPVGNNLLGRVINSNGEACDDLGEIIPQTYYPAFVDSPDLLKQLPINKKLCTGIRVIDSMLPIGFGQSIGLFAGSGVGKTTLLSMISNNNNIDINVFGIIGERTREIHDFLNNNLKKDILKHSVVVIATSDEPAANRLRAAYVCTAIAEFLRDQGKDVMLMIDSLSRVASAQREIDISNGKMPVESGYTSGVFEMIPKLLARSGKTAKGSITAIYSNLFEVDDLNNPIVDKVFGMMDSRIILSRSLANNNHYPAIDLLKSYSKTSKLLNGEQTQKACSQIIKWIALYDKYERIIDFGNYIDDKATELKTVIQKHKPIEEFLIQDESEYCDYEETIRRLSELSGIEIPQEEYEE